MPWRNSRRHAWHCMWEWKASSPVAGRPRRSCRSRSGIDRDPEGAAVSVCLSRLERPEGRIDRGRRDCRVVDRPCACRATRRSWPRASWNAWSPRASPCTGCAWRCGSTILSLSLGSELDAGVRRRSTPFCRLSSILPPMREARCSTSSRPGKPSAAASPRSAPPIIRSCTSWPVRACDYFAVPVAFGNGVVQAAMFATRNEAGFGDDQIAAVGSLATPLAAALEPIAMRRSTASLARPFSAKGRPLAFKPVPSGEATWSRRRPRSCWRTCARFTPLSLALPPDELLTLLGRYFEAVVNAVRAEGGDVLEIHRRRCPRDLSGSRRRARQAGRVRGGRARSRPGGCGGRGELLPAFVTALHVGPVIYGNVGSASRLDFTVVGPTVNTVSRWSSSRNPTMNARCAPPPSRAAGTPSANSECSS